MTQILQRTKQRLVGNKEAGLPLLQEHLRALKEACAPPGKLPVPSSDVIHVLRQYGYIEIVPGGIQITPMGLERLLDERKRASIGSDAKQVTSRSRVGSKQAALRPFFVSKGLHT